MGINREFMIINIMYHLPYQQFLRYFKKKLNCDLLSVTFSLSFNTLLCPLIRCTLFQTSLSIFPVNVFLFHWLQFRHKMSSSFSSIQFHPVYPLLSPSSHCCICWRFFFLVYINEWNLSYIHSLVSRCVLLKCTRTDDVNWWRDLIYLIYFAAFAWFFPTLL